MNVLASYVKKTSEITLKLVSILGQLRMKFLRSPQKFLSQLNISVNLKLVDRRLVEFLRPSQKFCPSYHFDTFNLWLVSTRSSFFRIFESLSKLLSQFPFLRKMEILREIWPSRCGAYVSRWGRNQVKRSSPLGR